MQEEQGTGTTAGETLAGERRGSRGRRWLLDAGTFALLAGLGLGTWHIVSPRSSPINYFLTYEALPALPHAQRPLTMDPALFTGQVAEGYRIARARPELLERLPCYCGCYLTHAHQNNLDCFRDRHGEDCQMCLEIAVQGEKMARAGYSIEDIKAVIDRKFAPRGKD